MRIIIIIVVVISTVITIVERLMAIMADRPSRRWAGAAAGDRASSGFRVWIEYIS